MKPPPKSARPRPFTGWALAGDFSRPTPAGRLVSVQEHYTAGGVGVIRVRVVPLPAKRRRKAK